MELRLGIRKAADAAVRHYAVLCIVFSLVALMQVGVGNVIMVGAAGLMLCIAGLAQGGSTVDPWAAAFLLAYELAVTASSIAFEGGGDHQRVRRVSWNIRRAVPAGRLPEA